MRAYQLLPRSVAHTLAQRHLWAYLPQSADVPMEAPPSLALSFDLDYQADTDALIPLLSLLEDCDAKATFFSIGALVAQSPEPYRAAFHAGHEIGNHTQTHPDNPILNPDQEFWHLSHADMCGQIRECQETIEKVTGQAPTGFRTPHFKDHPKMLDAIASVGGIDYISTVLTTRSPKSTPYYPTSQTPLDRLSLCWPAEDGERAAPLMIPLSPCPGLRWSPFCSYSSIRRPTNKSAGAGYHSVSQWVSLWRTLLKRSKAQRFASAYFDPMDIMRDAETVAAFRDMLTFARDTGWQICRLDSVASRWRTALGPTADG